MTENDAHPQTLGWENSSPSDAPSEVRNSTAAISAEELNALVANYEARLDEVADLITRVRHEINNPLTGVLGQAQLLLREDLNEKARKRAETIEELAIRIRDIVAQLRQVQKPSRS
ncbi:MAG TPA: histidine kinase dimerization/phospho-acceptor domain-containing protein [Pyrinomonadaceae bacterium]|nr:histidine kinase dimerization/phospho-acceptor domain-containing protein [Pyrinomonadaceae bacterium]